MSYAQTEMAVFRYGEQLNIDWTNATGRDVAAGQVVDLGTFVGIALEPIKDGEAKTLCIRGVFDVLKQDLEAISLGQIVLWDVSNAHAYVTGGGYSDDACMGKCVMDAATTDLTVRVSVIETAAAVSG